MKFGMQCSKEPVSGTESIAILYLCFYYLLTKMKSFYVFKTQFKKSKSGKNQKCTVILKISKLSF